ncbi:MAG: adenylate/guanylate cyclase domain-containing protein [Marmoricola sp.]
MLVLVVVLAVALVLSSGAVVVLEGRRRELVRERDRLVVALDQEREVPPPLSRRRLRAAKAVGAVGAVVESAVEGATRLREQGVTGLLMSSIEDLSRWAAEDRGAISRISGADGTVTILFSDIEDSTLLNDQLGDEEWVRLLTAHDAIVHGCVARHRGHVVKSQGDGFMIVFPDPASAVRAGIAIQDEIGSGGRRPLRRTPIRVRVGIHCGPAVERDGDFFGTNVAMAARVAAQAQGGEILVSDVVRQALRGVEDVVLVDARETPLKGLPGTHRLWQVSVL